MTFNSETPKLPGQKWKRGPSNILDSNIKEKMEILYEEVLDYRIIHQTNLSLSYRVKRLQRFSNYLLPKTKSVRDDLTLEKIAFLNGWISKDVLINIAKPLKKKDYGEYLINKYSKNEN